MAITNLNEKFAHELRDIYDAEHQFLEGQQLMLQNATDPKLQNMITTHIGQTQQHIRNLEQVFNLLGQEARRETCAGAKGIVTEGQKVMKETSQVPAIRDCSTTASVVGSAARQHSARKSRQLGPRGNMDAVRDM